MADNSTAFILPQWLLLQGPGMQCRPHNQIIGMMAAYNIVAVIVSVLIASPFFYRQKRIFIGSLFRLWRCIRPSKPPATHNDITDGDEHQPLPYDETPRTAFLLSVVGSIIISVSAPLLAGITITRNHPEANYWVLVQQWATRPRATLWVFIANLAFAIRTHQGYTMQEEPLLGPDQPCDGYLETAVVAVVADVAISLLPIKFLYDQTEVQNSPDKFQAATPCTNPAGVSGPNNCPDMQIGAYGLWLVTVFNTVAGVIALLWRLSHRTKRGSMDLRRYTLFIFILFLLPFIMFVYCWMIWSNFLGSAPESLYCVQSSALVDVVYLLLPVALGLWRLACSLRYKL